MFSIMNKSINNLKEALTDFLECQLESPDAVFSISEDSYMLDESLEEVRVEGDVLFDVVSSITNCCYTPDGGEELFPSDGKPQLIMKLEFYDVYNNGDMERLQKIQSLPIYKKFTHLKIDPENRPFEHWLYVDCGDDDFLFDYNIEFYQAMRDAKIPCQLRVRDGGHVWEYWRNSLYNLFPFMSRTFGK